MEKTDEANSLKKEGEGSKGRPSISQADVENLLQNNSPDAQIKVLDKITALYNDDKEGASLGAKEAGAMEDIFRALVKSAETEVRVAFSNSIKNSVNLPKDIALNLAKDIDEVALPMLEASQVLNEEDLLQIISSSQSTKQLMAIARREHVSGDVSAALIAKDEEVIETLLNNAGTQLHDETYSRIIEKSGDSETIVKAMVEKGTMSVSIMEKLLKHVSGKIRKELDEKYQVVFESAALKKEMENDLHQATMRMMGLRSDDAQKKRMLKQLSDSGKLPPFVALVTGDYTMFEVNMARLARISLHNVRILLNDQGETGFKALYKKTELPEPLFEAAEVLVKTIQMLEAEQYPRQQYQVRIKTSDIIKRMKTVVGNRKINNLDFLVSMMEHNLKF